MELQLNLYNYKNELLDYSVTKATTDTSFNGQFVHVYIVIQGINGDLSYMTGIPYESPSVMPLNTLYATNPDNALSSEVYHFHGGKIRPDLITSFQNGTLIISGTIFREPV